MTAAATSTREALDRVRAADAERRARRAERHGLRDGLRELMRSMGGFEDHGLLGCGLVPCAGGGVQLRLSNGVAGFAGLSTCGSQACPVCASKIAAKRADELRQVLTWARAERMTLAMVTLTVRHQASDPLAAVWDAVAAGWAEVTSGSVWASETEAAHARRVEEWTAQGIAHDLGLEDLRFTLWDIETRAPIPGTGKRVRCPRGWKQGRAPQRRVGEAEAAGVEGWVKAVEVTHGQAGWHVHVHAVLLLDYRQGETAAHAHVRARILGESMHARWAKGVARLGFESWRDHGGLDVTVSDRAEKRLADYLTKAADEPAKVRASVAKKGADLAMEATLGGMKAARSEKGRTPFQIAADAVADLPELERAGVLSPDIELWDEYVRGSYGRRLISWSSGLRDRANLDDEQTDEQIAAEEVGTADDAVATFDSGTWWSLVRRGRELLDVTETQGRAGAYAWLDRHGYAYTVPEEDPHRPPPRE